MNTAQFADQLHGEKYRAPNESFKESQDRIAAALKSNDDHYYKIRAVLRGRRFLPAGRVQAAAGSPRSITPYNCFVSGDIVDSFVDGDGSIMQRATEAAATMRLGGGIGYNFSPIRPRGSLIVKLGSRSAGPMPFMNILDSVCKCIASAGHRRGAQMGILNVDHPDIEEFIHAKQPPEWALPVLDKRSAATPGSDDWEKWDKILQELLPFSDFNFSIGITDEFMVAVEQDLPFDLKFEGKVHSTVSAQALWEKVMRSTWDWAEPGVVFIDKMNSLNNLWYCESILATNPCFTGDTKVWTAEHGHVAFRDLVGKTVDVLTEAEDGRLVYRTMSNIRMTQASAKLVRVRLDNDTSVRCTPQHRFFLKDGSVREAQDLRPGDSLKGVYRYNANGKGYVRLTNGTHQPLEHHVPFERVEGLGSLMHAHHVNHQKADNRPSNLELKEASTHMREHMEGDNNPLRRFPERNPMKLYPDCTLGTKNGRWRSDLSTGEMLAMREGGAPFAKIARALGCSKYTVQKRIKDANHKVVRVDWLEEREDVYCGTVDDPTHRFIVATGDNDGVLVANCGEQPLPAFGACLLGSFNLTKYVGYKAGGWGFDTAQFKEDIPYVVEMMDNVVDDAVFPLPEQKAEALSKRRMGLGVTGVANAIESMGKPYGSTAFCAEFDAIMSILVNEAYKASALLARDKGSFPLFNLEKFQVGKFFSRLQEDTKQLIRKYGLRNSHLISIAPCGTISLSAGNISSSIEPVFAYEYLRTVMTPDGPTVVKIRDYGLDKFLVRGKQAADVTIDEHLAVLEVAAYWSDSAVSKTCNVPADTKWGDFKDVYMRAWKMGAKGVTTFTTGGKRFGVLNAQEDGTVDPSSCQIDPLTGRKSCE